MSLFVVPFLLSGVPVVKSAEVRFGVVGDVQGPFNLAVRVIQSVNRRRLDFAVNLDRLVQPPTTEVYLELKARTWSRHDALQKAEMISELLEVLAVDKAGLVQDEYVSF